MTVLVSTHYMDEAERCHRINYISYGRLIAEGTVAEVVARRGLIPASSPGPSLDPRRPPARRARHRPGRAPSARRCTSSAPTRGARRRARADRARDGVTVAPAETSLEDVFIHFMGEAPGTTWHDSPVSLRRLRALLAKEFIQMRRDRITFAMMLGVPLILLVLFGFAINNDPKRLPAALVVASHDAYSRAMISALEITGYYRFAMSPRAPPRPSG